MKKYNWINIAIVLMMSITAFGYMFLYWLSGEPLATIQHYQVLGTINIIGVLILTEVMEFRRDV